MLNGKSGPHYWISPPPPHTHTLVKKGRILFGDKIHYELFTIVFPLRTTEILFNLNNIIFVFPLFLINIPSLNVPSTITHLFYPTIRISVNIH